MASSQVNDVWTFDRSPVRDITCFEVCLRFFVKSDSVPRWFTSQAAMLCFSSNCLAPRLNSSDINGRRRLRSGFLACLPWASAFGLVWRKALHNPCTQSLGGCHGFEGWWLFYQVLNTFLCVSVEIMSARWILVLTRALFTEAGW